MVKPALTEGRYAVCIGINQYHPSSGLSALHYAEQDAQAIDDVLGQLGFPSENRVLLCGKQATLEAINRALADVILDKAQTNDLIVFYFAGHSIPLAVKDVDGDAQRHSEVFLTSYDFDRGKISASRAFRLQLALGMERIRRTFFESEGSRKRLFLFDSCYSGDFYGPTYRDEVDPVQGYIRRMLESTSAGRVALSSCLPIQKATEDPMLQHGRFTYHLLEALQGKAPQALRLDGCVTVNSLFDYVADQLPVDQRPVLSGVQQDIFVLACYPEQRETKQTQQQVLEENQQIAKGTRLSALLANHRGFLHNRLASFVGRQQELLELQQRIADLLRTGGYLTITGHAGQGKSSIIAKLVEQYGIEQIAYHFIPFNPGPDHQVGVLRNLMARLILKYDLSDIYVASESRPALRDYFPKVLEEVAAKGGQEIIFLDGLDQLEEDVTGVRDLSFLPTNPPPGTVFVLGTRPNDVLAPLELLKPHTEYQLPPLSRGDFDLLLHHRQVKLEPVMTNRFYQAMEKNALYLDLVAKELFEQGGMKSPEAIITRLANNPENIFSLAITRLKRQKQEWREVMKPVLGILLAAREPLSLGHIRNVLQLEYDRLKDGITRLGGLIADTGQGRYTLFHLKLYDYLRQNEQLPGKAYIFAADEEEAWHAVLSMWCEKGGLPLIWKDVNERGKQDRRLYARRHYITHLYWARRWQDLFDVLDEGTYGHAKERYDVSTRSYLQDLDFGRRAAAWSSWMLQDGLEHLPYLWRYTLLRCSLRSRADQYPSELFDLLLLLGREQEALGHAELLTNPKRKALVFQCIAEHLSEQPTRKAESQQLSLRAYEVARAISGSDEQAWALRELATALAQAQRWEQAEAVARSISESNQQAKALSALATALAQAQRWEQAEAVVRSISGSDEQAWALSALATALAQAQCWEQAEEVARAISENYQQAEALSALATALAQAQRWEQAEEVARSISGSNQQAEALSALATALAQAQRWEQAESLWKQAEEVARSISGSNQQAEALSALATALAQAQCWEQAEEVARSISGSNQQAEALSALATALAQAQRWEQAESLWKQAEEVARSISESYQQARALSALATALAQAQRWEQAEEVARSISGSNQQAEALSALATALAQAQRWEQAEEVVRSISESDQQARALSALATALAQAQRWEQAEEVARSISESYQQARALSALATALAQAQRWEQAESLWKQAEEVARAISESYQQAWALSALATALAQAQRWEQAEEVARAISESYQQARALSALATALAQAQRWEQAESLWKQAEEVARAISESYQQAWALSALATALAQAQRWEQAESLWEQAEEVARAISESNQQARTLSALATALAQAQRWEQAEEVARAISESYQQARALRELATALAQAQCKEQVESLWKQAEEVARAISESNQQARALRELATALAQAQRWKQAEEVARAISESYQQAWALRELATALAQAQRWEQAEEIARSISESNQQAWALSALATALAQAQRWEQAESLWKQAEEVARSISGSNQQAEALSALATALAQAQCWEQAEEIAHSISGSNQQAEALSALATALAQAQCWEQAEEVAHSISGSNQQARALSALATALAQAQCWEQAEEIAHSISGSNQQARALSTLATALAQAQRWEQAEEVARAISESYQQAEALSALATALAQAQRWEQAEEVARAISESNQQAEALSALATALAQAQRWEQAEEVARAISESYQQIQALRDLVEVLLKYGNYERVLHIIQRSWLQAETRAFALEHFSLAVGLLSLQPEMSVALYQAFKWVDTFLES